MIEKIKVDNLNHSPAAANKKKWAEPEIENISKDYILNGVSNYFPEGAPSNYGPNYDAVS